MTDKDWTQTINLTIELVKYSTTFNMALFAAISWLYINWNQKLGECYTLSTLKRILLALGFVVNVLGAFFHYQLFQQLIAVSSEIPGSQNPVSETIKDLQSHILWALGIGMVLVLVSALIRGVGTDAKP
jgi:hypothetical protein